MVDPLQAQIDRLREAIAVLEAQRATLGEVVVEPALAGLRQQLAALEAQAGAVAPPEERRVITILFTDIVGSTSLAEKLDPEEWRQTVAALHATIGVIVQRHRGTVAQYLGDGLLALFGAQTASEDDPEHAVHTALEAQVAVAGLALPHPVQIRIGVHTGLVVVGELGSDAKREFTATGDAMNLAARLQSAAPPGGILVSQDTYRHVRGVFDVTPQPPLTVRGRQEPVQTYLVRRVKPRAFRAVSRGVAGMATRTVGREAELRQLQAAYLAAFEHRKVVWVQLVGEPGVGKTRLLEEMIEWVELRPELVRLFRARAHAEDVNRPFALVRRMWFDRFQITEDAPLPQAEAKWVEQFRALGRTSEIEPAQALGLLMGLLFKDSPHISGIRADPAQVKGRAFVVSREHLRKIRQESPVEIYVEDLQWVDASSWEYLTEVLLEAEADERLNGVFILGAARPEWNAPEALLRYPNYIAIDLQPLSDEATRALALELVQDVRDVPDEVVDLIVQRSEGVPYFAEELVNWFLDRRIIDRSTEPWRFVHARLRESPLPATLQHLLLTRLSGLSDGERAALQRGAVIGRHFWTGGVEALGIPQAEGVLRPLQPRGFVAVQPDSSFEGETEWSFRHALLREVTYESVLRRERAALHRAAAVWLEEKARLAGRVDEFAGLLGEHTEWAGDLGAAAGWYLRAGERAKSQAGTREARRFFDRALSLLPPVDQERRWRVLLGREDALDILGETDAWRSDLTALLQLAKDLNDDARLAEAHYRQADHARKTGDFRAAVEAAEAAVAAARSAGDPSIEVKALAVKVRAQGQLGLMSVASPIAEEALSRAREIGDDRALAVTLPTIVGYYADSVGDSARAAQLALENVELQRRLGDRAGEAVGLSNLGSIYRQLGLYKQGRGALTQAIQLADTVGARRGRAYALHNLGEIYLRSGDNRTARQMFDESLKGMTVSGDAHGRAFMLWDLSLALEQAGDVAGALRRFEEAKDAFGNLGARGEAIESLAGMARCSLAAGRLEEARQYAGEVWDHLKEQGRSGMQWPGLVYQTCADVFDALGEQHLARDAAEAGYRDLMERASKISDPEWRESFLENVAEHRALVEMWERVAPN